MRLKRSPNCLSIYLSAESVIPDGNNTAGDHEIYHLLVANRLKNKARRILQEADNGSYSLASVLPYLLHEMVDHTGTGINHHEAAEIGNEDIRSVWLPCCIQLATEGLRTMSGDSGLAGNAGA